MKIKITVVCMFIITMLATTIAKGEEQKREVAIFSEIALNIPAKLYLEQGSEQRVRIVAKASTLEDIITEVNGRKLIIRFPNKNLFMRNFNPGKVDIYITVPSVDALGISGSGDIIVDDLESRILQLAVSGIGNIEVVDLDSKNLKVSISGSGKITIGEGGIAEELAVSISGSGNFNGKGFAADEVTVNTSGSGSSTVHSNGTIKARIAGSGNVYYVGNPSIDATIAGSGKVREL